MKCTVKGPICKVLITQVLIKKVIKQCWEMPNREWIRWAFPNKHLVDSRLLLTWKLSDQVAKMPLPVDWLSLRVSPAKFPEFRYWHGITDFAVIPLSYLRTPLWVGWSLRNIYVTDYHAYVQFVLTTIQPSVAWLSHK